MFSLACSDFGQCLTFPLLVLYRKYDREYGEYPVLCAFTTSLYMALLQISIMTLFVISVDRFFFIVYAILYQVYITKDKLVCTLVLTWVFNFIYIPTLAFPVILKTNFTTTVCEVEALFTAESLMTSYIVFALGVFLSLILYTTIAYKARAHAKRHPTISNKSTLRIVKMLTQVFIIFIVLYTPNVILRLLIQLEIVDQFADSTAWMLTIFTSMFDINLCINIFIYYSWDTEFRKSYRKLLGLKDNVVVMAASDGSSNNRTG